jgi:hypothetical protein
MNDAPMGRIEHVGVSADDFGHEVAVGGILRSYDSAIVEHGGTYVDSVTTKPRQFDYRCWIQKGGARLVLAVECKNIDPRNPMIVCGTTRYSNESIHDLIESRQGRFEERNLIQVGLSSVTWRVKTNNEFYPTTEFVGKSLLRFQSDKKATSRAGESEIYDRWTQALSSAVELAKSATKVAKHLSMRSVLTAIVPVVVVPNKALRTKMYDSNGTMIADPDSVDQCAFFIDREIEVLGPRGKPWFQTFTFSHVHFFTVDGFRSFLDEMVLADATWKKLFNITDAVKRSAAYPHDPASRQ